MNNNFKKLLYSSLVYLLGFTSYVSAEVPEITGAPVIDKPVQLEWPLDIDATTPDLSEPTSNRIYDLHAEFSKCDDMDIILSTAGNYHMALRDLWYDHYLVNNPDVKNWYYSTSPPISPEQIANKTLTFGNLRLNCIPGVAVGPRGLMNTLRDQGALNGDPIPVIRNYGNVILVKKGNPRRIKNIWDLGRANVKVVTSNPYTEPGSFGNYSSSIFNIANSDMHTPRGWTAEKLFGVIFNGEKPRKGREFDEKAFNAFKNQKAGKWLAGARIHHREVPWSVAYGEADAGLMFYHLALYMVRNFPEQFEIVPLGGTVDNPEPVEGNRIATMFIARINGEFSFEQEQAREALINEYLSPEFDLILENHGLRRPVNFSR